MDRANEQHQQQHFLVVAYGVQGHVNPARQLARRLARASPSGSLVTLSVPVFAHRRMFPSLSCPDEEVSDGLISYIPYSNGFDDGQMPVDSEQQARSIAFSTETLSNIVGRLAARGRTVTCMISTLVIPSVHDVARDNGIPIALYWITPATCLAAYYHYFHGYNELLAAHASDPAHEVSMPGLPPLRIRDFPSQLVSTTDDDISKIIIESFQQVFENLDRMTTEGKKPKILVNSFDALEADLFTAMQPHFEVIAVGPMVPSFDANGKQGEARIHLFEYDKKGYMEWLSERPEKSVVYVSFGSIAVYKKRQLEEIVCGLRECGRPYLWVVRKENREEGMELEETLGEQGMVVEWCEQLEVLSHPSVGCFVTHCGWNSTLEAVTCGTPIVAVPQFSDQTTNAWLVEEGWGVGVRAERGEDGVLVGSELARCVELVMGDGEKGTVIREKATVFKEKAREAIAEGGPTEKNLRDFVQTA